jgi:5-hydroxyisourate hydrolase
MGKLSTHVLDTTHGRPASGLTIKLYKKIEDKFKLIKSVKTNNDGRCEEPLLEDSNLKKGGFELVFEVENYFSHYGIQAKFLKDVVIRFYIEDENENYHIPLLISPYAYSTYRGS